MEEIALISQEGFQFHVKLEVALVSRHIEAFYLTREATGLPVELKLEIDAPACILSNVLSIMERRLSENVSEPGSMNTDSEDEEDLIFSNLEDEEAIQVTKLARFLSLKSHPFTEKQKKRGIKRKLGEYSQQQVVLKPQDH